MLDKTFDPNEAEPRLYRAWLDAKCFQAGHRPEAPPYCIVIPPPNVTGSLHMGHALNNTLQDILCRFERMRGKDVLWQPGTDHAGIATQQVVERRLAEDGNNMSRRDMGREAFVQRVWEWKEESGGTIINQLKRLGASCDWSRERFTMDEGLSKAVLKVFVTLYREGLIYKDKRLVNWDPGLLTAISDLEVVNKEQKGNLWHFQYPLTDGSGTITVATTRPETMLGDSGVAVHPEDERYKDLIGKTVRLPIVGREIPIVADEYADPEQGSGAVKITPAHDFNDFEVGRRQNLRLINIMDQRAHIALKDNEAFLEGLSEAQAAEVIAAYDGLDRFEARKKIVSAFEDLGLLQEIEEIENKIPYGDRSDKVIEPYLTDQWYVDAATLAKPAIEAVERGETVFVPRNWEKTYFEWMRNIQPWCISRQLWWGHQIPAWYSEDGEIFVAETEDEAYAQAREKLGKDVVLTRDEDVLDTWFSSALWPFSTLGWPDKTPELGRYYKTDVLVTGFDIIFFWIARMMMAGMHFMQEVPFHTVYVHALVRDEKGQKMSKSRGNVVDPLELIDAYGADALRFTLTAMAAQGRDVKLSRQRVEGYRNFGTKLWNAARFCQMNECVRTQNFDPAKVTQTVNKWIVGEAQRATAAVTEGIEAYRFNDAANSLYHFVWHIFCDWYLEFAKPLLNGKDEPAKAETRATAAWVLDEILKLMHPFSPFITEELWQRLAEHGPARASMLTLSTWPAADPSLCNAEADDEMGWVVKVIEEIRSVRAEMNVPAAAKIPLLVKDADEGSLARLERHDDLIRRLARLDWVRTTSDVPKGAAQVVIGEGTYILPLADVIDMDQETQRLGKELDKIAKEIAKIDGKLGNEKFISNAPEAVIEEQRERKAEAEARGAKLREALARLEAAS